MIQAGQDTPVTESSSSAYEETQISGDNLLGPESVRDQSSAGLHSLSSDEYESFRALTNAYRDKFGFPLVVCVREHTKETILASGKHRLENSPAQEKATALVEIAKIANLRLQDLIEAPVLEVAAS